MSMYSELLYRFTMKVDPFLAPSIIDDSSEILHYFFKQVLGKYHIHHWHIVDWVKLCFILTTNTKFMNICHNYSNMAWSLILFYFYFMCISSPWYLVMVQTKIHLAIMEECPKTWMDARTERRTGPIATFPDSTNAEWDTIPDSSNTVQGIITNKYW